jgi:hypothetical protein
VLFEDYFLHGDWRGALAISGGISMLRCGGLLCGTGDLIRGSIEQETFLIMDLSFSGMLMERSAMIVTQRRPMITFRNRFVLRNDRLKA